MLQQSHPEGRQTFKSTNIFLTRWPETDLVVIHTILSLLLFRRHADILSETYDVPTAKFAIGDAIFGLRHIDSAHNVHFDLDVRRYP